MSLSANKTPDRSDVVELWLGTTTFDEQVAGTWDDAESKHLKNPSRRKPSRNTLTRLNGWKPGALSFSMIAFIIFIINLVITIWGLRYHPSNHGVLFEGDCNLIKNYNTGLHVLINIISTILVSGSNYCMQCLSAPNRREIDQAHAQGKWLDIGIPSLRNLNVISLRRRILWVLLGLSSVPLHLL